MRVTAVLIVRDESAFISDCLASLEGIVDEIVVVDTGSTDDTIEKASRFPVKLHRFEWRHDFSAARNFALEQATGDWILYIDADERLEVPDLALWREAIRDRSKAGWKLRFYPRVGWTPYYELRLFRNDPRIRFRGVIHERVHETINLVCRSDRREIGACDIALHHIGYEGGQHHKISRNVPLLRESLAKDPTRVYCWWHLGEMLLLAGDEDGAAEAWQGGIEAARAQGRKGPPSNGLPFFSLSLLRESRGLPVEDLIAEAVSLFPTHLALRWLAAKYALERGQGEQVLDSLEELALIEADTFCDPDLSYNKWLFTYAVPESLALCHFRAGRYREAAEWYRRASVGAPDPRECQIRARLAEAKSQAGCSA